MIETFTNPSQIVLQYTALTHEGTAKLDVLSGSVRVFHLSGGVEVEDLPPTPLVQSGATSVWRYIWVSPLLAAAGTFIVEYTLADEDVVHVDIEDLTVRDAAAEDQTIVARLTSIENLLTTMGADMGTVLDVHLGRQKLNATTTRWTLYTRAGAVLKEFDVKNDLGAPSVDRIFDRIPV